MPARRGSPTSVLLATAVALLATLPFLNKAFHIDDVLYLRVADQILRTPLDPYQGLVLWDAPDGQPASLFMTDYNPPLWKYILAATIHLVGREEWKLHLVESAFVLLAAAGIYRLGRRLDVSPAWLVAMILLAPFFLPGQNIMLEGPMLAGAAWSVELALAGMERDDVRLSWLAGVFAALAILTKYTAGLILPPLALAMILRSRARHLVLLIPPIVFLAAWSAHNVIVYGRPHFGAHGVPFDLSEGLDRSRTLVRTIGGMSVFGPWLALRLFREGWPGRAALLAIVIGGGCFAAFDLDRSNALLHQMTDGEFTLAQGTQLVLFTFNGAVVLGSFAALTGVDIARGRRTLRPLDADSWLEMWMLLSLVFNVVSVPFQAVRHFLLFFLPTTIRLGRLLGPGQPGGRAVVTISSIFGIFLAVADYQLAGMYRDVASEQVPRHRLAAGGSAVWATGNWGWIYYATQAGAAPLVEKPEQYGLPAFAPGQFVLNPTLISWKRFPPTGFLPVAAVGHLQPSNNNWLRTLAPVVNYYFVSGYALPWEILLFPPHQDEKEAFYEIPPLDDIVIFRIQPPRK